MEDVQGSVLATASFLNTGLKSCSPGGWPSVEDNTDPQGLGLRSENGVLEMLLSKRLPCFANATCTHLLFCLVLVHTGLKVEC